MNHYKLASMVPEKMIEKYDEYLPEALLDEGFGRRAFDIDGTLRWVGQVKALVVQ
ncbi:hypothetical protein [Oceanobacter mangrovi]|uniref:hypothetical protein n=1 Tax=Oceanobacter mangrovi TaxID=2862510 RepID=UPI001C8DD6F0|nr:hypothetical protein [Oceanobacter mangrovi]